MTMIELRDYQRDALAAFLKATHGTLALYPGSGKTLVALAAIKFITGSALIVTPTLELVHQYRKVIREEFPEWNEIVEGDNKYRHVTADMDISVITYASAIRKNEEWFDQFCTLVFDESHHLAEGEVYRNLLIPAYKAPYALGLTATPPTDPDNISLQVLPVVFTRTFEQGLADGYAAPLEVHMVFVELTPKERAAYAKLTEEIRVHFLHRDDLKSPLFTARKQIVALASAKFEKLMELATQILRLDTCGLVDDNTPTRILVWSEFIPALERAKEALNRNGQIAELVTGETPKAERVAIWQRWGTDFPILLAARVAEEGIDFPQCAHGIIMAGARTTRQNVQRVGRLLRPLPNKTAQIWTILAADTMETKLAKLVSEVMG